MKANKQHTEPFQQKLEVLESHLSLPEEPTKEMIWDRLEAQLEAPHGPVRKPFLLRTYRYAMAAILLILLGFTALLRYYTTTVLCHAGQTVEVVLPDHSTVVLNSDSKLSYNPLWWNVSRELRLTGEAWFSVTKGKRFKVHSVQGTTTVLGTKFNIYSRADGYKVTCFSGRVKVESTTNKKIVLNPSDEAEIVVGGDILYHRNINTKPIAAWKNRLFIFTAMPLEKVIKEMERRYNRPIRLTTDKAARYTGSFPDTLDLLSALHVVCKPFGLNFALTKEGTIVISK